MSYNLHDLRIEGMEVETITGFSLSGELGQHTQMKLSAYIENEQSALYKKAELQPIRVFFTGESQQTVFQGIVTQVKLKYAAEVWQILIEAKSYSYLMDIAKRSRSFQDTSMPYSLLVKKILLEYGGKALAEIPDRPTGELLVQYQETDWAFLKRVLSNLEMTVTPACEHAGVYIYAGFPDLGSYEIPHTITEVKKDMHSYYYLKANDQKAADVFFTKYGIKSASVLPILGKAVLSKQEFTVCQFQRYFSGNELESFYRLQKQPGLKFKRRYPMHLIGVALEGTVADINQDKVQVYLDIDEGFSKSRSYWFPYSTISASPDGSGWYCMPEKGDVVRVYFPSKFTSQAVALSAVSNYKAAPGSADKMQNPNTKYLSTKHDKAVILEPDQISITCNGGAAVMNITKDGDVSLSAEKNLIIAAEEDIEIYAENELSIHAQESVVLACEKGGQAVLPDNGYTIFNGTEVKVSSE